MNVLKISFALLTLSFLTLNLNSWGSTPASHSSLRPEPRIIKDFKYPNSPEEGQTPVEAPVMIPSSSSLSHLSGYTELLPYVLRSPYQDEAGSCLYMSLTGIAEWWLSRLNPTVSLATDGPIDLSERFLMNYAGLEENSNGTLNWKTDSMEIYNQLGYGILNSSFRFTKNYYVKNKSEKLRTATSRDTDRQYGTTYNWINTLDELKESGGIRSAKVNLPQFKKRLIFSDPESNQWNTGVAPKDIVSKVKLHLQKYKAPIMVIYNHYGYWHANFIVGFDDESSHQCPFVKDFFPYMKEQTRKYEELALRTHSHPANQNPNYSKIAAKYSRHRADALRSYQEAGGCSQKGVFYVRDSIYRDPQGPIYDYDLSRRGDEDSYSKKIVLREYEWLQHLSNHVIQIDVIK